MSRFTIALLVATCAALAQAQGQTGMANTGQTPSTQGATVPGIPAQSVPAGLNHPQGQANKQPAGDANTAPSDFSFDKFTQFSAVMSGGIVPSGDFTGHVYRSGNLMRMEGNAAGPNYFLTNLEAQETHGYASTGCIDFDYPYSRSFPFILTGADKKYEIVPAGKETVDGHVCRVEDLTISSPKLKQPFFVRVWLADDLQGFPVKVENRRPGAVRWSIHYTEVTLGAQDRSLFLIPNQCESYGLPDKNDKSPSAENKNDSDKKDELSKPEPPASKPQ
jgi:hypothetical protein